MTYEDAYAMSRIWAARDRAKSRIKAYAAKYGPILAKLSETEFCGLIEALGAEGDRRTAVGGREENLFLENAR